MNQSQIASRIPQLKETISTQHTKIYIADKKLILSGVSQTSNQPISPIVKELDFMFT